MPLLLDSLSFLAIKNHTFASYALFHSVQIEGLSKVMFLNKTFGGNYAIKPLDGSGRRLKFRD